MIWSFRSSWLLVFTLAGIVSSVFAEDWPQWRGPNRDGISREKGWLQDWPAEGPKQIWEFADLGVGYSTFAVSQGRIYTMGNVADQDRVVCLDAETGKLIWKHEYACGAKDPNGFVGPRGTPTVDGERVYTLSRHGHFYCLDAKTGRVVWSKNLVEDLGGREPMHGSSGEREGWGYSGSALIEKDWVLIEVGGLQGASVVAFDKKNGEVVWKAGNDGAGYSSLVVFDHKGERCLAHFSESDLVIRRLKDGSEMARTPWKTSYNVNAATPVIFGDSIFVSSGYGSGCALYKFDGTRLEEVWRNKNMRNHVNSCVLVDGYLYGFDEGELKCLDWNSGEVKWGDRGYGKGSLIVADGKLILYSQSGKLGLAEVSPEGFKQLASFQALKGQNTWANPVLANSRLYVRSQERMLALDLSR
jgi:outer membrane protein assembly factor BamB